VPCVAWDINEAARLDHANVGYFCQAFNLTGQSAASITCGLTPDNLPVGLQVVAPLGGEATLIGVRVLFLSEVAVVAIQPRDFRYLRESRFRQSCDSRAPIGSPLNQ
jgi:Asp-tRNA(Asn)/Glu-tRNA(Gln) amidotransferase A subunit family amidase